MQLQSGQGVRLQPPYFCCFSQIKGYYYLRKTATTPPQRGNRCAVKEYSRLSPEKERAIKKNVFIMGLSDFHRNFIRNIPNAALYEFHGLLTPEEFLETYDFPVRQMLERAEAQLNEFRETTGGSIDAIVGYMDFPVSTMLPILCEKFGTRSPTLESLLKCEHKYWSRLEQQKVIPDHIPEFRVFNPFDVEALQRIDLPYPLWVKPIKSSGSFLGFYVDSDERFVEACAEIRAGIGQIAEPFNYVLEYAALPPEIQGVEGHACLAESIIGGRQCTVEGYSHDGAVHTIGIVDSIRYENEVSFFRYEYPSSLPDQIQQHMSEITATIIAALGYDNGAFNLEFYWDRQNDKVWLLEINTRVSQSHSFLFEKVDGTTNQAATIETGLGHDPSFPHREGEFFCSAKFFWRVFEDGVITRVPSEEEYARVSEEMPDVIVRPQVGVGTRLSDLLEQDSYSYAIAYIFVAGHSRKELLDKYMRCRELLPFEYQPQSLPEAVELAWKS